MFGTHCTADCYDIHSLSDEIGVKWGGGHKLAVSPPQKKIYCVGKLVILNGPVNYY